MENITNKVLKIISELSDAGDIDGTEGKLKELGFDSLKMVELIIALEDEFNIRFTDSDLNPSSLQTIHDLIVLVKSCYKKGLE